ncbi:biotin--[acetyl-CoA-carboxylase] ligase [Microbacterium sp. NPDC078428]|uniref:biotin--[acetyl-CoA-carboxylase] ligase n=1 Tax=Microbacterium sp. NPDC078428 TaxID=3364190 RepID=UPI0037CB8FBC
MPLTAADLPRTAALVPRLECTPRTGSTNADLVAAASADPGEWPHLSMLVTDDQSAGRGRLGRVWTAPPGTALAASIVIDASGVPPSARGWIPLAAGAALTRAIAPQLAGVHTARLKWPNDVLVDGRKISGILAEGVGGTHRIVVGAGINTRMPVEELPVETATSFAALGVTADADALLADYVDALREHIDALARAAGDAVVAGIHAEIESLCDTVGRAVRVILPEARELIGEAVGIGADGGLLVRTAVGTTSLVAGDVVHVR